MSNIPLVGLPLNNDFNEAAFVVGRDRFQLIKRIAINRTLSIVATWKVEHKPKEVFGDLDVDASAPPVGVGVLDLRIGEEDMSLLVDGEAELRGHAVPLGVGGPPAHHSALAPARPSR